MVLINERFQQSRIFGEKTRISPHTEADDVSPDGQDGTLYLGDLNDFCQVKTNLRKDHFNVRICYTFVEE